MTFQNHPAAELFPLMTDAELKELAEDIQLRGQVHPVILHEDKVLDGRNRVLACERIATTPRFEVYAGTLSPTAYVISANLKRRQLTPSQKTAVAAKAAPMFEAEAKARKLQNLKKGQQKPDALTLEHRGRSVAKAAEAVGVSPAYVYDAKKIQAEAPAVFEQIERGEKTISEAKKELWEPGRKATLKVDPADDKESDALFQLKRWWRKASKKDRRTFIAWTKDQ